MNKMAELVLMHNTFQIIGPVELAVQTSSAQMLTEGKDPEEIKDAVYNVWQHWYVKCGVSGETVSLRDLRYWDVAKQEVYARPELVPKLGWYVPITGGQDGRNRDH